MSATRWFVLVALSWVASAPLASGQPSEAPAAAPSPMLAEYQPQLDEYTVREGDTLWDICARHTGSPWHWPRVWSYNPEITNPHWIYPGDIIRFQPSDIELPAMADVLVAGTAEVPQEPTEESPAVVENAQPVKKTIQFIETAPRRSTAVRTRRFLGRFVTARELAESGTLTNAAPDKILLAPGDTVFFTFPKGGQAKAGQRYMIYRTAREVTHPVSGELWGYMTEVTGFASVSGVLDEVSTATITDAVVEIERGQLVTPLVQVPFAELIRKPATAAIDGYVIAVEDGRHVGEDQLIFVDIGKAAGLELGNELTVLAAGDPVREADHPLPLLPVGRALAVDVKETAATCIVIDAQREITPGMAVRTVVGPPQQRISRRPADAFEDTP